MKIKVKRLTEEAMLPRRMHASDVGYDLYSTRYEIDGYAGEVTYHTDLAIELPAGYAGLVFPRSSVYKIDLMLSNCVGVIDPGYRDEIKATFRYAGRGYKIYEAGERIAQLVVVKTEALEFDEVDELSESDRGKDGYGSTGNK